MTTGKKKIKKEGKKRSHDTNTEIKRRRREEKTKLFEITDEMTII